MKKLLLLLLAVFSAVNYTSAQFSVSVGNDTSSCQTALQLHATPSVPGNDYVFTWSPATGLSNANIQNPIANHVNAQQYIVNVLDTVTFFTATDTIIVSTLYPVYDTLYPCEGAYIMLDIGAGYTSYNWQNYNDGTSNFPLSNTTQTITVNGTGTYLAISTNTQSSCTLTHLFTVVDSCTLAQMDSVYPGDCNYDLYANAQDFLSIGLAYGDTTIPRTNQSIVWDAHYAANSGNSFANGLDYKHADCNGDGIINFDDTTAIIQNHFNGPHVYSYRQMQGNHDRSNPLLYVVATPDTCGVHSTIHLDIYLGDSMTPVNNIYGISFRLSYSPTNAIHPGTLVDTIQNSFMGIVNSNLLAGKIHDAVNPFVDFGIVGIDHHDRGGFGLLGTADVVTEDNLSGIHVVYFDISDVHAIDSAENQVAISTMGDSVVLINNVGIPKTDINETVHLFPIPAKDKVYLFVENNQAYEICFVDVLGRNVLEQKINSGNAAIDVSKLPNGVYTAKVLTDKGVVHRTLQIAR